MMNEEVYTSFQWLNKPRGEGMRKELTRTITAPARPRRTASEAAWMKATLCTRTGRPGRPVSKTFQRQESEKKTCKWILPQHLETIESRNFRSLRNCRVDAPWVGREAPRPEAPDLWWATAPQLGRGKRDDLAKPSEHNTNLGLGSVGITYFPKSGSFTSARCCTAALLSLVAQDF